MKTSSKTCKAWGVRKGVHEVRAPKPMLTPKEQVNLLKAKGVSFERYDEQQAIEALSRRDTFIHLASYRRLFQKHAEGREKGRYVNLDFADLLALDELDAGIRHAFLFAAQDVERFAKTTIITRISEDPAEDGYGIVADFMESQQGRFRGYVERDLSLRMGAEVEGDVYSGRVIAHYCEAMPVWAFLEVVTFGALLAFYLFCSRRLEDETIREEHYILKGVKSVRNCCSHGSCILNGMDKSYESDYALSSLVYDWLSSNGIPNSKTRRAKLKNRRIQQLLETLVMFDRMGGPALSTSTVDALALLRAPLLNACDGYGDQNGFVSYLMFLASLIDKAI